MNNETFKVSEIEQRLNVHIISLFVLAACLTYVETIMQWDFYRSLDILDNLET